jgi:hypothetical protein
MSARNSLANKGVMVFKLLFPLVVLRWIIVVMLAAFLVSFALMEIFQWELAAAFALIACINLGLICALTMPTQMVAFASSRTASYLGNSRSLLLIILIVFSLLLALTICWGWNFTRLNHDSPLMLLGVWLVASLILQASVWICSRQPGAHLFLLAFNMILVDVIRWLELWNPLLISLTLILSWVVFAWWWMNWRPAKYKVNPFFIGMVAQQKMGLEQRSTSWFHSGAAKSWLGSRLAGMPDGWAARAKRLLPSLVMTPLVLLPGYIITGDAWLKSFVHFFFLAFSVGLAQIVQSNHALNLCRVWLYSSGDRNELFLQLQKCFWADVLPFTLLFISVPFSLDLFLGTWRGTDSWLYFLLSVFLMQSLVFHLFWWVYQRTHASLVWANVVCGGLVFWWFLMSFATGFLIKFPVSWQDMSPLWIVIPQLVLLALIYKPARRGFASVNFARAG